jgi:sugar lactone lactonase YvrE
MRASAGPVQRQRLLSVGMGCVLAMLVLFAVAADAQADVYWTDQQTGTIGRANPDGSGATQSLITGASAPAGIAVDAQHIYWVNASNNSIARANLDGSGVNESFITGANAPVGIAVDGQHIYWANQGSNAVGRANLDGTGVNQAFITGTSNTYAVAVDAQHVYWTNANSGSIGRADLNGSNPDESFITGANNPLAVAVDGQHVYWSNFNTGRIGRANLDGSTPDQQFVNTSGSPFGLTVDAQAIYWADRPGNRIGKASLDGATVTPDFVTGAASPTGVASLLPPVGPPTVAITTPPDGATYALGAAVTAAYSCAGGANGGTLKAGTAGCAGPVAPGQPIDTSTPGTHAFTVTATDSDGQSQTATSRYIVDDPPPPTGPAGPTGTTPTAPTAPAQLVRLTAHLVVSPVPTCVGSPTVLDASGSTAGRGGPIVSYTFTYGETVEDGVIVKEPLASGASATPTVVFPWGRLPRSTASSSRLTHSVLAALPDLTSIALSSPPTVPIGVATSVWLRDPATVTVVVTDASGHTATATAPVTFAQTSSSEARTGCPGATPTHTVQAQTPTGVAAASSLGRFTGHISCVASIAALGSRGGSCVGTVTAATYSNAFAQLMSAARAKENADLAKLAQARADLKTADPANEQSAQAALELAGEAVTNARAQVTKFLKAMRDIYDHSKFQKGVLAAKAQTITLLGESRYQIPAGKNGTVAVALSPAAHKILKRYGILYVRLITTSISPNGKTSTKFKTVELTKPRH